MRYRVSLDMSREQLIAALVPGTHVAEIVPYEDGGPDSESTAGSTAESTYSAMIRRRPRALRGSKVNDTILKAMSENMQSTASLKKALEDAGLAPGSLSTGLAALQKEGTVIRVQSGIYDLDRTSRV